MTASSCKQVIGFIRCHTRSIIQLHAKPSLPGDASSFNEGEQEAEFADKLKVPQFLRNDGMGTTKRSFFLR